MTLERRRNGSTPMSTMRVTAPAASLVWIVESTRWPVSDALIAISTRLLVADLADHDDVGILPEEGAQRAGEGEADLRLDVHLVDAADLVLDRILGREDVEVRLVDAVEARVERRRLAASRSGR